MSFFSNGAITTGTITFTFNPVTSGTTGIYSKPAPKKRKVRKQKKAKSNYGRVVEP